MEPPVDDDACGTNPHQSPREPAPAFANAKREVRQQSRRRVGPFAVLYLLGTAMLLFLLARLVMLNLGADDEVTELDKFAIVLTAIVWTSCAAVSFFADRAWWRQRWLRGLLVFAFWVAFWTFFLLLQIRAFNS
jgi:hypothetical protein